MVARMVATEIAARIHDAWVADLTRAQRAPVNHDYMYASGWHPCDRCLVEDMIHADQVLPWPADILARFQRGDDREIALLSDLMRIGRDASPPFRIVGQQERFELRDRRGRVCIVGKVDARIEIDNLKAPLEIKSWSPFITDRVEVFDDLFANPFTQRGAFQLLSYLYGASQPIGFLLLDRSGLPRLLPVELDQHWDHVEAFLQRAERALDHIEAGTMPDYHDDPAECRRCRHFGISCNPPIEYPAAVILTDPAIEAAIKRREELKAAAKEFDALDKDLKARLRGIEHGIIGEFELLGTWGKSSRVDLPPDVRKQYTITDPHGRFTLEIVRHAA